MMMHVVLLSMGVVCTATPAIAVVGSVNVDITMQANGMKIGMVLWLTTRKLEVCWVNQPILFLFLVGRYPHFI